MLGAIIEPRTLNVNIKARRLGYVVQCLGFFEQSESLTVGTVFEKLESWSTRNKERLKRYISSSGYITKTAKHYPAKRYVELTRDLQLIDVSEASCRITKLGKPLLSLETTPSRPFDLSIEQRWFLLRRLLISDFDYLLPHFRLLTEYDDVPTIFRLFKSAFLTQLEEQSRAIGDIIQASEYRKRIDNIKRWTKEKKYLEHIIYPRINWLIDLKLVDWNTLIEERRHELSKAGSLIASKLESIGREKRFKKWFETSFYTTLAQAYDSIFEREQIAFLSNLSDKQRFGILKNKLEEAFSLFSSLGTPFAHMSANTFLEYACIKLLKEGIIAEFKICKEVLKSIPGYRFRWEPVMNDGFITKV